MIMETVPGAVIAIQSFGDFLNFSRWPDLDYNT